MKVIQFCDGQYAIRRISIGWNNIYEYKNLHVEGDHWNTKDSIHFDSCTTHDKERILQVLSAMKIKTVYSVEAFLLSEEAQ